MTTQKAEAIAKEIIDYINSKGYTPPPYLYDVIRAWIITEGKGITPGPQLTREQLALYSLEVMYQTALHPEYRKGQTMFNVLAAKHPEIADKIRGTQTDPFHTDTKVAAFWGWITGTDAN